MSLLAPPSSPPSLFTILAVCLFPSSVCCVVLCPPPRPSPFPLQQPPTTDTAASRAPCPFFAVRHSPPSQTSVRPPTLLFYSVPPSSRSPSPIYPIPPISTIRPSLACRWGHRGGHRITPIRAHKYSRRRVVSLRNTHGTCVRVCVCMCVCACAHVCVR